VRTGGCACGGEAVAIARLEGEESARGRATGATSNVTRVRTLEEHRTIGLSRKRAHAYDDANGALEREMRAAFVTRASHSSIARRIRPRACDARGACAALARPLRMSCLLLVRTPRVPSARRSVGPPRVGANGRPPPPRGTNLVRPFPTRGHRPESDTTHHTQVQKKRRRTRITSDDERGAVVQLAIRAAHAVQSDEHARR
jgi:hypothetical protein